MPVESAPRFLVIAVLLICASYVGKAQSWQTLDFAKYGRMGSTALGNTLNDSSQPLIAISMGGYIFLSTDSAKTLRTVELPIQRSFYGDLKPFVASDSIVYVHSTDIVLPNNQWIVSTTNRGISWQTIERFGSPYNVANIYLATESFLAIGVPLDTTFTSMADISTDGGRTWLSQPILLELENTMFGSLIQETKTNVFGKAGSACIYRLDPLGALESTNGGVTWQRSKVMPGTIRYWHVGDSAMLSLTASIDKPFQMWRTMNRGLLWEKLDTIVFVNTDTLVDADHFQLMNAIGDSLFTFRTRGGSIVSTSDGGVSWFYRGNTPRSGSSEPVAFSNTKQGTLICDNSRTYYIVNHDVSTPLISTPYPGGLPLPVGDSVVLLAYNNALAKSIDRGKNWFILDSELTGHSGEYSRDDPDVQQYESRRLWWDYSGNLNALAQFDWIRDGSGSAISTSFVLDRCSIESENKWCLTPFDGDIDLKKSITIDVSNKMQRADLPTSPWIVQITEGDSSNSFSSSIALYRRDNKSTTRLRRKNAHLIRRLADGELMMFADSLLVSKDSAMSWEALPATGFPRTSNGDLARVTAISKDGEGTLYAGLSGVMLSLNGESIGHEPGGVWKSSDGGLSWTIVDGFPEHTHVLDIACCRPGSLFVYATNRTFRVDGDRNSPNVDYMYKILVVREGAVQESFSEFVSGPTPPGNRLLLPDADGSMLCSTLYSGLMRTSDAGQSWVKIGADQLDTVTINDVVISKNHELCIGTTKGVLMYTGTTSGMDNSDEEDAESKRTTVWTYPTPCSYSMRMRLNNIDLITSPNVRLYVCNLMGEEVLDLSEYATRSNAMNQFEFDVLLGDLPSGTYGVILLAGSNSWFHKLMVVH